MLVKQKAAQWTTKQYRGDTEEERRKINSHCFVNFFDYFSPVGWQYCYSLLSLMDVDFEAKRKWGSNCFEMLES